MIDVVYLFFSKKSETEKRERKETRNWMQREKSRRKLKEKKLPFE